jgi:hypothetical protein
MLPPLSKAAPDNRLPNISANNPEHAGGLLKSWSSLFLRD